jgi:hypothetical protein
MAEAEVTNLKNILGSNSSEDDCKNNILSL